MLTNILKCGAALACGIVVLAGLSVPAGEKKGDKSELSGKWTQKGGELKIEFAGKDVMKIAPHGDSAVIGILCNYTVEKKSLVKAEVSGYEGTDEAKEKIKEHLPIGFKFSFQWTVKGDAAKLEGIMADNNAEKLKSHLEGDFERKK